MKLLVINAGTNVMVRARPCFMACRFDDNPHAHDSGDEAEQHRSFFSEILVAEDIDLGSRIHTLGFKSVFLCEVLALGEVRAVSYSDFVFKITRFFAWDTIIL